MKRSEYILDAIIFLFTVLFVYASVSKLLIADGFQEQLEQSPLIPRSMIPLTAYLVPVSELILVVLLYLNRTRLIGLYASFFMMVAFTFYLVMLLSIGETVPCSCGGILGEMSFSAHIVFNIVFCLLGLSGIWIETRKNRLTNA